ncbi:MAG: isoleucine--tRNA ligase [Flavobacteriaceae bacterium]|nr:MAG: isoleucine--tRNA ligase [Flavobacteriaceae bacterium]
MSSSFKEYNQLDLVQVGAMMLEFWQEEKIFEKSISTREGNPSFVFFEGPPSANGMPGIHHVMGRTIKDIFCRYQTLKGKQVRRKAGWDTHGLPVELGVEKELGITKEDIGVKISVEEYNKACMDAVMRYTDVWNNLTQKMGYWVDMEDPYITYKPKYMESVWWLLSELYQKGLMYKGYTIQPYSPKAGTGLSSAEINQPGCYRDVTDTTVVAQFKINESLDHLPGLNSNQVQGDFFFLAWTTTPWTLPSNTALTVGPKIQYVLVTTFNQYTFEPIYVILAKNLVNYQFSKNYFAVENLSDLSLYQKQDKKIPYFILGEVLGEDLVGLTYQQLLPFALPYENAQNAFRVIPGDFVTTEDGTGIVHTAPTFGADDAKVAKDAGVPGLLVLDENGNPVPLVDLQGRFRPEVGPYAGMYVKNEYYLDSEAPEKSADVQIAIQLKTENRAFKVEKYVHNYPHCWRTDKPILYYPLDSWFIKVSEKREEMVALNQTIGWKPSSTGTGRFGKWLENANDWNLSRSRFWGIPIPIWSSEDKTEQICISSVKQLKEECQKAVLAGLMKSNPLSGFNPDDMSEENYAQIDLHKNYVDQMVLVSASGKPMYRDPDLCDVWFDSGAMPYAQWHYPFENKELIDNQKSYPADFIAEGVDQTRGWFYTLHAISSLIFNQVAYKNVVSNGLVLDKNGQKMSKRLGNAIDPFETLAKYGPDATRLYMISNAQPWENLKFDVEGIDEVKRKFFGTLYNTYSFFALYANVDGFTYKEEEIPLEKRDELDRWILSELHTLTQEVDTFYSQYEPTRAARAISDYVQDNLSNWYVRLSRRRFWKGSYTDDKIAAYQTLYTCLKTIAKLASPIAPFFCDRLYQDLNGISQKEAFSSVHLCDFPKFDASFVNQDLQERTTIAQKITSMVFSLRKKENLKVRQPLKKIMVPVLNAKMQDHLANISDLLKAEVNVKEVEILDAKEASSLLVKEVKPNFKALGPKFGSQMKEVAAAILALTSDQILSLEEKGVLSLDLMGQKIDLEKDQVEIITKDIPGCLVMQEGNLTVALDISLNKELIEEGMARELVNRIQNLRKDKDFLLTDRINVKIQDHNQLTQAVMSNYDYICGETLADQIQFENHIENGTIIELDALEIKIEIEKS